MPKLYILVGIPGSGKSTWVFEQHWAKDCVVINTDSYVSEHARRVGKTYSDVFADFMPEAIKLMVLDVKKARTEQRDIIWDQTSTTIASRARKFHMLPEYHAIAVVFQVPEAKELSRRLASRPGKFIPEQVVQDMIVGFESPTLEEGFKEIWYAI